MIPKDYTKILDNSVAARVVKSHESAIVATHEKKFFVTKNGYMGIGPLQVEPGD
jgi:hypothetical protein